MADAKPSNAPPDVGFYGTNNIAGYQHGAAIEVAIKPARQAGINSRFRRRHTGSPRTKPGIPAASNLSPFDGPRDRSIALPPPSVKAQGGRQGALLSRGSWRPSRARRQHWETLMSNKCTPCRRDSGRGSECTPLRGGLEDRFPLGPLAPMPDLRPCRLLR